MLTAHQALCARDPAARALLVPIARDELRHAAWSWRLASWAEPLLRPAERAVVAQARRAAVEQLDAQSTALPERVRCIAGLPDRAAASRLAASLRADIAAHAPA